MTSLHHVSEHVAINGTKSRPKLWPKSGPSWDHVGTKSGPSRDKVIFHTPTQLSTQSPTQLNKISLSQNVTKSFIAQVTEQVFTKNHREHRGHRDLAAEVGSTARVTAKVTAYPGACKT